jgi:hypothetical protein
MSDPVPGKLCRSMRNNTFISNLLFLIFDDPKHQPLTTLSSFVQVTKAELGTRKYPSALRCSNYFAVSVEGEAKLNYLTVWRSCC